MSVVGACAQQSPFFTVVHAHAQQCGCSLLHNSVQRAVAACLLVPSCIPLKPSYLSQELKRKPRGLALMHDLRNVSIMTLDKQAILKDLLLTTYYLLFATYYLLLTTDGSRQAGHLERRSSYRCRRAGVGASGSNSTASRALARAAFRCP